MAKRLYIAATRQNDGKTTVSLGLISALMARGMTVGYMKPVGQRVVKSGDAVVDEDVLLIKDIYGIHGRLEDTSPIGIPKGFTEKYIHGEVTSHLPQRIVEAFENVASECDVVIIEGTGHAGVGSVIDLSNAQVARMLEADVMIVTVGGIGRPFDEVALNRSLFRQEGVEVLGVVANKVLPSKIEKISHTLGLAFTRLGCELFGTVPTVGILSGPTIAQVLEDLAAEKISAARDLSPAVTNVVIGTTKPDFVAQHFVDQTLLITSGDRDDLIETALEFARQHGKESPLVGILLTNGLLPKQRLLREIEASELPVLGIVIPSYAAANKVHDLLVKIRPTDKKKIQIVRKLIAENVDVDGVLARL